MDIFDPLVGMGKATSSAELSEKARGASFADKLFTPLSGESQNVCLKHSTLQGLPGGVS